MAGSEFLDRLRIALPDNLKALLPADLRVETADEAIAPRALVIESGALELTTLQALQAFATERLRALQA